MRKYLLLTVKSKVGWSNGVLDYFSGLLTFLEYPFFSNDFTNPNPKNPKLYALCILAEESQQVKLTFPPYITIIISINTHLNIFVILEASIAPVLSGHCLHFLCIVHNASFYLSGKHLRPFQGRQVALWLFCDFYYYFFLLFPLKSSLPSTGPIVELIVGVLSLGLQAAVTLVLQTSPQLERALGVGKRVFLLLQFGVVVGKFVEKNGDGHAVEDDAKGNAAKGHAAPQIGDGDHVSVAYSGDAHLGREDKT